MTLEQLLLSYSRSKKKSAISMLIIATIKEKYGFSEYMLKSEFPQYFI